MDKNLLKKRINICIIILVFLFASILVKLGYITFVSSNEIDLKALDLWSRDVPIYAPRGNIYDRNGEIIVGNEACYTVVSINKQIKNKEYTADVLANILEVDKETIIKHLNKNNSMEIIKPEGRKIDYKKALEISNNKLDGIYISLDTKRYYPYNESLASLLGFCGVDNEGLSGIEYKYNDYLKGQNGALSIYTDAKGNLMHDTVSTYKNTVPGMNIYLTIDIKLQQILDNVIYKANELYNPIKMMGLMISAKTGEVLAMTSFPSFDPSNYQAYDSSIYNRILPIFTQFELGSTFKILTYSMALEENLFDINDRIFCGGSCVVVDRKIRCWKSGGHGSQTFLEGIQNSCNVCFMELARRIGVERFYKYLELFGMTEKTGIDLSGEGKSIIVNKDNCGPVELATQGFGQSSAYTPIELVMASIAAVNQGNLYKPYVLKEIETYFGEKIYENKPQIKRKILSEKTTDIMKYALECVVAKGSGVELRIQFFKKILS